MRMNKNVYYKELCIKRMVDKSLYYQTVQKFFESFIKFLVENFPFFVICLLYGIFIHFLLIAIL